MGLFGKDKRSNVPEMVLDDEQPIGEAANYNTVIDYLVGLSKEDYEKVGKVAVIYREANLEACAALGVDCEPTSFITAPKAEMPEEDEVDEMLDDELAAAFLEDEPKPTKKKRK